MTTLKSVLEILIETSPPFEISFRVHFNALRGLFCSGFSSGFSPRSSHESRDLRSRTGVADAKKFHRELTAITKRAGGERGEREKKIVDPQTKEHDATLVRATARKRLPYRIECRSRQAEDYLNRHRGPRREEAGEETATTKTTAEKEKEERACNEVMIFICRAFGEPVAATRNIPLRVRGRNAPDAIDSLRPSVGIRGARRNRN